MKKLSIFAKHFGSVTCSKNPTQTLDTLAALDKLALGPLQAHITCSTQDNNQLPQYLRAVKRAGAKGIIALRGDGKPQRLNVCELIQAAQKQEYNQVFVAAYPEVHPMAQNAKTDLDILLRKQDAGVSAAITQFFFGVDHFLKFREQAAAHGITMPLIPGILPLQNWSKTQSMAQACGTSVAPYLAEGFERAARERRSGLMAIAHATELCDKLIQNGVGQLHFYTINHAEVVAEICTAIGKAPQKSLHQVA